MGDLSTKELIGMLMTGGSTVLMLLWFAFRCEARLKEIADGNKLFAKEITTALTKVELATIALVKELQEARTDIKETEATVDRLREISGVHTNPLQGPDPKDGGKK